ncbi:MAG: hypothetical protein WC384_23245 [Prolixibacteraceae bacterium]|jgi:hypothetical protein
MQFVSWDLVQTIILSEILRWANARALCHRCPLAEANGKAYSPI